MKQISDFAWPDRAFAEIMAQKHRGTLLALLDNLDFCGWVPFDDVDPGNDTIAGWGVSSKDGESMLDENEQWVVVA